MTMPSAGVVSISSSSVLRRRRAATTSGPYSTKLPGSTRSSMFSRAVRWPVLRRRATASGRASSQGQAVALQHLGQVGADVVEVDGLLLGARRRPPTSASSRKASGWPSKTVSPTATVIWRTTPETSAAITCSIFMASMIISAWPARTSSPDRHRDVDHRALQRRAQRRGAFRPFRLGSSSVGGSAVLLAERQHRQRIDGVDLVADLLAGRRRAPRAAASK